MRGLGGRARHAMRSEAMGLRVGHKRKNAMFLVMIVIVSSSSLSPLAPPFISFNAFLTPPDHLSRFAVLEQGILLMGLLVEGQSGS